MDIRIIVGAGLVPARILRQQNDRHRLAGDSGKDSKCTHSPCPYSIANGYKESQHTFVFTANSTSFSFLTSR
jgi:hypothetical protein